MRVSRITKCRMPSSNFSLTKHVTVMKSRPLYKPTKSAAKKIVPKPTPKEG